MKVLYMMREVIVTSINHTTINNGVIKDAEYFRNYFKKQKVELFIFE